MGAPCIFADDYRPLLLRCGRSHGFAFSLNKAPRLSLPRSALENTRLRLRLNWFLKAFNLKIELPFPNPQRELGNRLKTETWKVNFFWSQNCPVLAHALPTEYIWTLLGVYSVARGTLSKIFSQGGVLKLFNWNTWILPQNLQTETWTGKAP